MAKGAWLVIALCFSLCKLAFEESCSGNFSLGSLSSLSRGLLFQAGMWS